MEEQGSRSARLRGRWKLLVVAAALAVVVVTVAVVQVPARQGQPRIQAGAPAPALAGVAVRGGEVDLGRLRHHVVLVSFLNSRADATAGPDPSRAQIVFLRSMQLQHARLGLRVIVVDAAEIAGAGRPSRDDLVNYTYDWRLDPAIAVLPDDDTLAHRFGVEKVPTTFLIGPDGVVRRRWDGLALPAELDFSVKPLLQPGSES